jgi:hypothetical protein
MAPGDMEHQRDRLLATAARAGTRDRDLQADEKEELKQSFVTEK